MSSARSRVLTFPREHGAWGLLLVPFFTGAAAGLWSGGEVLRLAPLLLAALALFWLRTPVESWLGSSPMRAQPGTERALVRRAVAILAAVSLGALLWLFASGPDRGLIAVGAVAAAAFLAQVLLKMAWRKARTAAQMIGAVGLTATAPAAYYVTTGQWSRAMWLLWLANSLFAVNQIHYVQLRIHTAKIADSAGKFASGRGFLAGQCLLIIAVGMACALGALPWYAGLAFVPLLYRGFAWFTSKPAPLAVRALGWSELRIAVVFGVVLVLGVRGGGF